MQFDLLFCNILHIYIAISSVITIYIPKYTQLIERRGIMRIDPNEEDLRDEYEYYDEWVNRDDELRDMSLEDYNHSRCVEDYGMTDEESDSGDNEDW